jgi:very-short-patch-repair endonuclease
MAIPPDILFNARELRATQTDAENLLWLLLRNRRFCGFKFRRQHPVSRFILDFYCHEASLAIELDGGGHADKEQVEYDTERTKELEGAGIMVLRFWNSDVFKNIESVLESIYAALSPSPGAMRHPLPEGEGLIIVPSPSGRRCPEWGG